MNRQMHLSQIRSHVGKPLPKWRRRSRPASGVALVALVVVALASALPIGQASAASDQPIYLPEPTEPPPPKVVGPRKVRETYPDESTRVERETLVLSNEELLNHGKYVEYYANGQKFAEGVYDRGVYDGQWSFWHENGQLCKSVTFDKGVPNGSWEVFRADGTLIARKQYENGKRAGHWQHFFEDGKTLKLEQVYDEETEKESRTTYFPNGKPRQKAEMLAGRLEGRVTEWDEAGRKKTEFTLVDGKLDGELQRWDTDGNLTVQKYRAGKRVLSGSPDAS